jgi:NAD(P)H dehydrogenase (quinone)
MRASWITSQDVGALVATAITKPELAGKRYTIGGPDALSGSQIAEAFTNALQRPITYSPIDPTDFGNTMSQFTGPEIGMSLGVAYGWQNEQPDDAMAIDMTGVLADLPVELTRLEDWVRTNRHLFRSNRG